MSLSEPVPSPADRRPTPLTPPSSATTVTMRLRGAGEVVVTLPYHLGYHPSSSLVVAGLQVDAEEPGHGRVQFVARVDLPEDRTDVWPTADDVTPRVLQHEPHQVLLVSYEDESAPPGHSEPLSRAVRDLALDAGVPVVLRVRVRGDRLWVQDGPDGPTPGEGAALPAPWEVPAVAEFVLLGRSPLRHRDDLRGVLAPHDDDESTASRRRALVSLGRAFEQHSPAGVVSRGHGGLRLVNGDDRRPHPGRDQRREDALLAWATLMRGTTPDDLVAAQPALREHGDEWSPLSPAPTTLAPDVGTLLAASLRDVGLRDLVITWLCPGSLSLDRLEDTLVSRARDLLPPLLADDATLTTRLAALCRTTPRGVAAAPLTVLANQVWWKGDGALAGTAVELALDEEPDYRLALLLSRMIDLAVSPRGRQPTT